VGRSPTPGRAYAHNNMGLSVSGSGVLRLSRSASCARVLPPLSPTVSASPPPSPDPDRSTIKSENIFWSEGDVTSALRARRNGHRGAVVWLTGLSGAGKSTLARGIERELFNLGFQVYVLDGDNVRHGLNSNLGFSPADREENIRRVGEVAKLMSDAGVITITAFISPYQEDRRRARTSTLQAGMDFIEIFVAAPLEVCEQRDTKGLYKRARAGEIKDFTGISAPYEAPTEAELMLRTDQETVAESIARAVEFLRVRLRAEVAQAGQEPLA